MTEITFSFADLFFMTVHKWRDLGVRRVWLLEGWVDKAEDYVDKTGRYERR